MGDFLAIRKCKGPSFFRFARNVYVAGKGLKTLDEVKHTIMWVVVNIHEKDWYQ